MSVNRAENFRRNDLLEQLLAELNSDLLPAESRLADQYVEKEMAFPLIFVMGPLRSGTTLFMQWLANTGLVAYPTNLLSRFYRAPIIGAKIQLLLTDTRFNFRDELGDFSSQSNFQSENGKTTGTLAPNEFWYFWRRFLPDATIDTWSDEELKDAMDTRMMKAELAGLVDVHRLPFAAKGMLFNYNIPFFDALFENILFVQISRDPVANVASVLDARKRQSGCDAEWYSFKIPEYESLKNLPPLDQAAGQVFHNNEAVSKGLSQVSEARKIHVQYERFCEDPGSIFDELLRKIGVRGSSYAGPRNFKVSRENGIKNAAEIERKLQSLR